MKTWLNVRAPFMRGKAMDGSSGWYIVAERGVWGGGAVMSRFAGHHEENKIRRSGGYQQPERRKSCDQPPYR